MTSLTQFDGSTQADGRAVGQRARRVVLNRRVRVICQESSAWTVECYALGERRELRPNVRTTKARARNAMEAARQCIRNSGNLSQRLTAHEPSGYGSGLGKSLDDDHGARLTARGSAC